MKLVKILVIFTILYSILFHEITAGSKQYLSAEESDPKMLQWMIGSPPPKDKLIMQPQSNYFSFPKLRWTVCHIREFLPTKQISRGLGNMSQLPYKLDNRIDSIKFKIGNSEREVTWQESLALNYTDGILILHQGNVVYERYFGCLEEQGKHAAMSMTKSITGLIAEILIAENILKENQLVSEIVPELKNSAFSKATVRQVMDMTTALNYSEDYSDPDADIWKYSAAASPLPKSPNYSGPNGYYEYLQTVTEKGKHGEVFGYKTINTDALGWILSRVSKRDLAQLISDKIWSKIGAEQDAYITIDALGTPFAGGGLNAGLRDLGRLGLLMLNEGVVDGEQIVPKDAIKNIMQGGDKRAFELSDYKALKGSSYRSMWWIFHNQHRAYAARGVHGQTIYIDPVANMVIVRFSSHPEAKSALIDPTSLPAYQAVADYLVSKE